MTDCESCEKSGVIDSPASEAISRARVMPPVTRPPRAASSVILSSTCTTRPSAAS